MRWTGKTWSARGGGLCISLNIIEAMITFKQFLRESIIDSMRKTLDRTVFSNPEDDHPTIDPFIKAQIESAIKVFDSVAPVHDYYLVGSILGKHYNDRSDLDVTVEILKSDVDDATEEELYALLKKMNGQSAHNSKHPINYHFNFVDEDEDLSDNFDNIYDIESGNWKKQTEDRYIDPEEFMDEFDQRIREIDLNAMEIRRNIIDIDMLKSMPKEEIEGLTELVETKLDEIEGDIEAMLDLEDGIAEERREAFKNVTPSELKKLGSKNALPINIIYKLIERYYYMDLIKALGDILHEDDEIGEEDIPEIKKAFRDFDKDVYSDVLDAADEYGDNGTK